MLCALLLLPLVAAVPVDPASNYVINVESGVLKNVQLVGDGVTELDLSGKEIRNLEKGSLDKLSGLKSLNLAKNSLVSLPDSIFSGLTSLEHLCLADNQLQKVEHLFVGLEKLRDLDISNNPVVDLNRRDLSVLPKNTKILTKGNDLRSLSTAAFPDGSQVAPIVPAAVEGQFLPGHEEVKGHNHPVAKRDVRLTAADNLKICVSKKVVTSLELLKKGETPSADCTKIDPAEFGMLHLSGHEIAGFKKGWFKLQVGQVVSIDFSNNDISELTPEMLNDLPAGLIAVDISGNPLKRIPGKTIDNEHLQSFRTSMGSVEEIDEDAFEKTKLESLSIMFNPITNAKFIAKLPQTLEFLQLQFNKITEIPDGAFSKLSNVQVVLMDGNAIERLQENAFEGLSSARELSLDGNQIKKVDAKAFTGLNSLEMVGLSGNKIADIDAGTFTKLEKLANLNLSDNKLTKITKQTFEGLSKTVEYLTLEENEIVSLEKGSFVHGPRHTLLLGNNNVSHIEHGAFDLPELHELQLHGNKLTSVDAAVYERLPSLLTLRLSNNEIAEIPKGACKNFGKLRSLDLSANPFKKLEIGALQGLTVEQNAFVYIIKNKLTEIEAGVFEEA